MADTRLIGLWLPVAGCRHRKPARAGAEDTAPGAEPLPHLVGAVSTGTDARSRAGPPPVAGGRKPLPVRCPQRNGLAPRSLNRRRAPRCASVGLEPHGDVGATGVPPGPVPAPSHRNEAVHPGADGAILPPDRAVDGREPRAER